MSALGAAAISAAAWGGKQVVSGANRRAGQRRQDYYNRRLMAIQDEYQRGLMAYEYDLNKRALDYANEYNLPINQVRRLMEAGINPASLSGMGEGGVMSGVSGGSVGLPSAGLPSTDAVGSPLESVSAILQAKKLQSDIRYTNSMADYYERQATDVADSLIRYQQESVALMGEQRKLTSNEATQVELNNKFIDQKNQAFLNLSAAQVAQTWESTAKLRAETLREIFALTHKDPKEAQVLASEYTKNLALTQAAYAAANRDNSQADVNEEMTKLVNYQGLDMYNKYLAGESTTYGYAAMNEIQIKLHKQMIEKDKSLAAYFDDQGRLIRKEDEAFWAKFSAYMIQTGISSAKDITKMILDFRTKGAIGPFTGIDKAPKWTPQGYPNAPGGGYTAPSVPTYPMTDSPFMF